MLVFLDTEFTNYSQPQPISIGMVTEDGQHELYIEISDFDRAQCSHFVKAHVLPLLGASGALALTHEAVSNMLREWFAGSPRRLIIACDSEIDWRLLLSTMCERPAKIKRWHDLRTLVDTPVFHKAILGYHAQPDKLGHHALRVGWLRWMDSTGAPAIIGAG